MHFHVIIIIHMSITFIMYRYINSIGTQINTLIHKEWMKNSLGNDKLQFCIPAARGFGTVPEKIEKFKIQNTNTALFERCVLFPNQ